MTDKELAKNKITELVARFGEHIEQYKKGIYNETQTRADYIDPFFEALGWDMDNRQGNSEAYRDVILEDKIKVEGATKSPDYCFTLAGVKKFFVEAKKPSVNIKGDILPAYQVRRYGWSAKLAIAIVTDFEEFAIYDCNKKPNLKDKTSVCRIKYMTYTDYIKEFDFIYETFAKKQLLKGSFDKYIQSDVKKRGTTTVDNEFLKEIETWRKYLAVNFALRNKQLTEDEINYAVQKTIDRIIFLRICEDRSIEKYGRLKNVFEKENYYKNLCEIFNKADKKYNSGLFDFKKDKLTQTLSLDNKVVKNIIMQLYYPDSPYEFSVFPVDILGHVYERFLGKTIRLTPSHYAKIEEKPEVRKAGGVYYTPIYIVDYIVENTVGKLIKNKTPKQIEKIKICDPACGSGSFLIGAYQYLLNYHLKYYTDKNFENKKNTRLTPDGNLTTGEKKRILLNNIYGVDIDPQAVEVTKLNLLLKELEGETKASITQLSLFNERVLPSLNKNIKCGNSLIGSDFYDTQATLFPEQIKKINAFDWEKDFPEIFGDGGFDVVIGNPPWGQKAVKFSIDEKNYLKTKYPNSIKGGLDYFRFFTELSFHILRKQGYFGFVLPDIILLKNYGTTRKLILDTILLRNIDYWGMAFENVNLNSCTIIGEKNKIIYEHEIEINIHEKNKSIKNSLLQSVFTELDGYKFNIYLTNEKWNLIKKLNNFNKFEYYFNSHEGIHSGNVRSKLFINSKINDNCKKLIFGREELKRYFLHWNGKWVHYDKSIINKNKKEYAGLGKKEYFETNKIILRRTGDYLLATVDFENYYFSNNMFVCLPEVSLEMSINYFVGLLNSKLLTWFYRTIQPRKGKLFAELKINILNILPISSIDFLVPKEKQTHDTIVQLVDNLLNLNKELHKSNLESQQEQLQRAIEHSENKIDEMVYELYGLNEEEIRIVEEK